jgi:osmoprotectant transport system substrate-binding protein
MKTFRVSLLAVLLAVAVAACGSSKSSTTSTATTSGTSGTASSGPGKGKLTVVMGDKNFTEEYILGNLYAQALQAKGYTVTLKANIGSSEITWKAMTSGQIDVYPEYTGTLLTAIAGVTAPPKSAEQAYSEAKSYAEKHGFTLLNPTPFYDSDALGTVNTFAKKNSLSTISDLKKLGHSLTLGGAPEFATREEGLVGLKNEYGLNPTFKPIAIGLTYKALDSGQVQVSDVFTTDPQLTLGKYTVLSDPKKVFGFQNVAPVVKQSLLTSEGPAFTQTLNAVSALLTIPAIQKMNAAVALDKQSPSAVAHAFLVANHLAERTLIAQSLARSADDVVGVRLLRRAAGAVVGECTIPVSDGCGHSVGGRAVDEALRVRGVAHQAVEGRSQQLRRGEPHVLVSLVDDQLHRRELRARDRGQLGRPLADLGLEQLERNRGVDQSDLRTLGARHRLAGEGVFLGAGQPEPVDPHSGQVRPPHARIGRPDPRILAGDHDVRAQREIAAAADAPAVYLGDHRLGSPPQAHELRHRTVRRGGPREILPRVPLAGGGDPAVPVVEPAPEVEAGAERASRPPQDDHFRLGVQRGSMDGRLELVRHGGDDRVQVVRPVQRDRRDVVGDAVGQSLEAHGCSLVEWPRTYRHAAGWEHQVDDRR